MLCKSLLEGHDGLGKVKPWLSFSGLTWLFPHQDLDTAPGWKKWPRRCKISFLSPALRAALVTPQLAPLLPGFGEHPELHAGFPCPCPLGTAAVICGGPGAACHTSAPTPGTESARSRKLLVHG